MKKGKRLPQVPVERQRPAISGGEDPVDLAEAERMLREFAAMEKGKG